MTLPYAHTVVCAVCGTESEQTGLLSTNTFGAPDLDGRPAPMMRDTMKYWIHECPGCGYCAGDLGRAAPGTEQVVRSDEYQMLLRNSSVPQLARRFLARAHIVDQGRPATEDLVSMMLAAIWDCDDNGASAKASTLRVKTACYLDELLHSGRAMAADDPSSGFILMADLYRRAGGFDEAELAVRIGLERVRSDLHRRLLEFELRLIQARDDAAHRCDEA